MADILTSPAPHELVQAVEANMAEQFAYFGHSPRAEIEDTPEMLRYQSGIPIAEYCGVVRIHFPADATSEALSARIQATISSFAAHQQSFFWWLGPTTTPQDLAAHLATSGFTYLGDGPGMAVSLDALPEHVSTPPGLSIMPVRDDRALGDWVAVAGVGYGEPEDIIAARFAVHRDLGLSEDLPLQRYVAYLDGRPVAMSALFLGAGVAGIYDVATAKDARGQGIGSAITLAPLLHARSLGYRIGVLQASEMGEGVYARLGFRQVCAFSLYAWDYRE